MRRVCVARTMPSQDVRLSVRLSHAGTLSKYCYIISSKVFFTMPYHSSFPHQTGWQYSDGDLPKNGGVKCKDDMKKSRFSTNISLYLANDARYSHYYGMRIGNRIHGTSLNDLQCPFQGQDYSTSNNLKMVQHIYTYDGRPIKSRMIYRTAPFSVTLNDP